MNVFVCAKYIPDSTGVNKIDPHTKRLVREGVQELDPAAASGVEEGLLLIEKHGGEVVVVTMGPEAAEEGVRKALAMGAERGILITGSEFAGSDTLATARALAAALAKEQADLVICAAESTDTYNGLVPGMLAELLDLPQLTFAKQIEIPDGKAVIHRQTETGYQVVEARLPALITVASGINEPRYPSLRGIMAAKRKEIKRCSAADLGLASSDVGEPGARERVLSVEKPPERGAGEIFVDEEGEGGKQVANFLERIKVL